LNGKLSLSDAEGVADVINAENEAAVRAAYRLMSGALSREIYSIQDGLLSVIAGLEASLDYPDEIDADGFVLDGLISRMEALLRSAKRTGIVKRGINAALIGKPNTGKSSLLNRFTGKDRAIVADVAGTTRDTLEECFEYDGLRLNIVDTAGLRRGTHNPVEKKGIERSFAAAKGADAVLYVIDAETCSDASENDLSFLKDAEAPPEVIVVFNKNDKINDGIDLRNIAEFDAADGGADSRKIADAFLEKVKKRFPGRMVFSVSALTGDGIDALLTAVVSRFKGADTSGAEISVNLRHAAAVGSALADVAAARQAASCATECALADLRNAFNTLGKITGQTATEDVIDAIFEKFCLGK
jgi:tRNA modification GTPase